jgi:hypothetical protein
MDSARAADGTLVAHNDGFAQRRLSVPSLACRGE